MAQEPTVTVVISTWRYRLALWVAKVATKIGCPPKRMEICLADGRNGRRGTVRVVLSAKLSWIAGKDGDGQKGSEINENDLALLMANQVRVSRKA